MAGKNYPKLPYIPVLRLRVNDVEKKFPLSMLCRMTWWTTFVVGPTPESLPLGLQNFLKFNDQIQHNAFLVKIFKKSYLPVCAHSKISSGTKVVHHAPLYKILEGWFFSTPFTCKPSTGILGYLRVIFSYQKYYSKILFLFLPCYSIKDLQNKKIIMKFGLIHREIWFFENFCQKSTMLNLVIKLQKIL